MIFHDSKVMNAGVWKGWHTLDCFYFLDIVVGPNGMHWIKMVIAAQHFVSVHRATKGGDPCSVLVPVNLLADLTKVISVSQGGLFYIYFFLPRGDVLLPVWVWIFPFGSPCFLGVT